jgi:hypothetical protein
MTAPTRIQNRTALPPLAGVALIGGVLFLAMHLFIWANAVALRGGPDGYVRGIDFTPTLVGATIIRDGQGHLLYDHDAQYEAQGRVLAPYRDVTDGTLLPYIHPPFEALAFAPLLMLPYALLYALWSIATLAAAGGAIALLWRVAPPAGTLRWIALAAAASYSPLYQALWLGQTTPLILLGLCGTYAALRSGHQGRAGLALALLVLKPQILVAAALICIVQRAWKALLVCAGVLGVATIAAMPWLGPLWPLDYARFLRGMEHWSGTRFEYPYAMYNWRGFAIQLTGTPGLLATALALATVAALLAIGWRSLRRTPAQGDTATSARTAPLPWAAGCLVAVLVTPHLYVHDLALLIFPGWLVAAELSHRRWSWQPGWLPYVPLVLGYTGGLIALFRTEEQLGFSIIFNVSLMACLLGLLAWQSARATRHTPGAG